MSELRQALTLFDGVSAPLYKMASAAETLAAAQGNAAQSIIRTESGATVLASQARITESAMDVLGNSGAEAMRKIATMGEQMGQSTGGAFSRLREEMSGFVGQFALGNIAADMFMRAMEFLTSLPGKLMAASDAYSGMMARLRLVTGSAEQADEMNERIYESALRARGSYDKMADSISKIAMTAKAAFPDPKTVVPFVEGIQKLFTIGGTGIQQQGDAMLQLTQALGSGKLQGDEFRSIAEAAPLIEQMIAKHMGVAQGELKQLGADGEITAEIIRDSILENMDQIDAMFKTMPMTWEQSIQSLGTVASKSFQPAYEAINALVNAGGVQDMLAGIAAILPAIGQGVADAINGVAGIVTIISDAFTFLGDHFLVLNSILDGASNAMGTMTGAGYALFGAITVLTMAAAAHAMWIGICSAATALWGTNTNRLSVAQTILNFVLGANPIVRIIMLVLTAIGAFAAWAVATDRLRNIFVETFRAIGEACGSAVNFVIRGINMFIDAINAAGSAWNKSVFGRMHQFGTASRVQEVDVDAYGSAGARMGGDLYDNTVAPATDYLNRVFNPQMAHQDGVGGGDSGLSLPGSADSADAEGPAAKETAGNTRAMLDAMGIMDEDLKFFRDVAEQESINRYTTAAVEINLTNNNSISGDADLDGYMTHLIDQVAEAAQAGGEAVHI